MKKLGFGFMRLPMDNGNFVKDKVCEMVDTFLEANHFNPFVSYLQSKTSTTVLVI